MAVIYLHYIATYVANRDSFLPPPENLYTEFRFALAPSAWVINMHTSHLWGR